MTFARFGTMIFGGAQIIIAIFAEKLIGDRSAVYKVLTIAGFASGPILGLFLLVAADKKFSQFAAIIGFVGSLIVLSCAAFGLPDEYKINGFYYCLLGSISTCCIAWLCDLFFNSSDVQN